MNAIDKMKKQRMLKEFLNVISSCLKCPSHYELENFIDEPSGNGNCLNCENCWEHALTKEYTDTDK